MPRAPKLPVLGLALSGGRWITGGISLLKLGIEKRNRSPQPEASPRKCPRSASKHVTNSVTEEERMNQSKAKFVRALLFAICASSLFAGAAHAESGANWKVNGTNISGALLPELQSATDTVLRFKAEISAGSFLEVECVRVRLENFKLGLNGGVDAGSKMKFSNCGTLFEGTELLSCKPKTPTEEGVFYTKALKGLLILHTGGVGLIKLQPNEGEVLSDVTTGEECAFGEEMTIGGVITLKECEAALTVSQVNHLFSPGPLTSLWMLAAKFPTVFSGSFFAALTGKHTGMSWSGQPN
jgi:hypothetical protein